MSEPHATPAAVHLRYYHGNRTVGTSHKQKCGGTHCNSDRRFSRLVPWLSSHVRQSFNGRSLFASPASGTRFPSITQFRQVPLPHISGRFRPRIYGATYFYLSSSENLPLSAVKHVR